MHILRTASGSDTVRGSPCPALLTENPHLLRPGRQELLRGTFSSKRPGTQKEHCVSMIQTMKKGDSSHPCQSGVGAGGPVFKSWLRCLYHSCAAFADLHCLSQTSCHGQFVSLMPQHVIVTFLKTEQSGFGRTDRLFAV